EGMQQGEIDMSTQYTGTAIASFEDIETPDDSDATLEQARELFGGEDFEFEVLDPLGFANTYAFTVREDIADEHGFDKVSELEGGAGDYSAGFDTAWPERDNDGDPACKETCGAEFGDTSPLAIGLVHGAVKTDGVDVVAAY